MIHCGICNTEYIRTRYSDRIVFKPDCTCIEFLNMHITKNVQLGQELKTAKSALKSKNEAIDKMIDMRINPPITMTPIGEDDAILYTVEGYKALEKKYAKLRDLLEEEE